MTTLLVPSNYYFVVVLLLELMTVQLLKVPNTGQFVQYISGWYQGCLVCDTPGGEGIVQHGGT